ncbi:zinc finger homeobox protein 4 isoform X2 [Periophthalmus magnuspinnatus]|uniref:zinc finger homeobox protein 4 isoform X2 n=1 Tax=Periophthalmus magnuspinnatus TaxID=409849 RepID=UPI002436B178|nr:zinc finger homeobox protein 4 isoform X2 [Periophthalmus magnuspinnatus]
MQEESGETVSSECSGVTLWLCPLCQQGQADRSSLSLHLTDQHSVLPSCVERLLDIAGLKQAARAHEATGAQSSSDAASSDLKEDLSSGLCPSSESSNSAETSGEKEMEEEKVSEQEKGESQLKPEEEGPHLTAAKQPATSVKAEIPDATEKSDVKKVPSENDTKPFKCYACLEAFPNKTALSVHYNSAGHIQRMKTGGDADSQSPPAPALSRPFVSNKPYQCAICRVSYNHAITLESHMKSVLHQTRSRNAGIVANSTVATSNTTSVPKTVSNKSGNGQLVSAAPSPSGLMKEGEQIQTSQVATSLLTSPVASTQAVSAFLTLLTSSPNTLSHSILPSLFAAGTAGAAAPQLVPQPQMVMPLILNGLQAQTQQLPENQQSQLLTQCVPFVGLSAAQQALLSQRFSSLQSQWPSAGVPPNIQPSSEEQKPIKSEREQDETDEKNSDQSKASKGRNTVSIKKEEEDSGEIAQNLKTRVMVELNEDNGAERRDGTTDGDGSTNQLDLEGDKATSLTLSPAGADKSLRNNNLSPSVSVPSNASLSPVNFNLTLSPDSTPQKSQSGTSPCGSLGTPKSSPSTNALTKIRSRSVYRDPPVLSEFQTEVLWAFLESRSEADAASPPREDCEALGREVGLSEDEVRRWLTHARLHKQRPKAGGLEHLQALARQIQVSDDEEERSLVIAEGEEEDVGGGVVLDLSSTRAKRKRKHWGKEGRGDSCLTSDSENEVYTSVIVSDEESQNGSRVESPAKEVAQHTDKGAAGGKVLRSTTVFLSDAEEEYEDEEGGGTGRRAKKRKGEFEKDEHEGKRERQDSDVDLELEAQGDPPSSQIQALNISAGALHSLPSSLASFSPQFLSPYVLSLSPSIVGDASKVPVFSNPPPIARFPNSLLSQSLSHNQTALYMANGGDSEGALDLSMGSSSKSPSSAASLAEKIAEQKGQLLDWLGLTPTSKGLVVVQVKPESAAPTSNSGMNLVNCNNMTKSAIYMRAAEKMNASLLEKEREKDQGGEQDSHGGRKAKGKRYRDMRRSRTIIHAEQLDILYGCYFKDPNPGKHEFEQISEWVQLPKKVVQIWFQNMRARERKGEVRFISDGTLAAVGKPLIKFTWPLAKPIFSKKPPTPSNNNTGGIAAAPIVRTMIKPDPDAPIVRTMIKPDPDPVKGVSKLTMVKKIIPIKPKEMVSSATASPPSAAPKTKSETTSNVTMVKVTPKVKNPVILPPSPKDPPAALRPAERRKVEEEENEEEVTDDERDHENQTTHGPGSTNRMVPKLPTTPINNRPSSTTVSQKQNGLNYWTPKVPIKINTLSREQLALPTHLPPRCLAPPPTPNIAPVSPSTPKTAKVTSPTNPPASAKSSPTDSNFLSHSSSRRPRTHLSCLQLSILQSCYETCAHPNCLECEAIGTELNLPLKVVQIWFQNTRAKEKRWKLQQEKMTTPSGEKIDTSSGSYLQYSALKANRPILPKPVHLNISVSASSPVEGQSAKELLTGHCDVCDVSFDSRAAAREHVFSQYHLATLKTTNCGQPVSLINKNGTGHSGSSAGTGATPQTATTSS